MPKSNYLSYRLRKIVEKANIRKLVGLQLASTMFIAAVAVPEASFFTSAVEVNNKTETVLLSQNTQTQITFIWPLASFQISQQYSFYHPGIDLTTSFDDPVLAIADGAVEATVISNWGYGKHVILRHDNGHASLYAHLDQILVKVGDRVAQGSVIGKVGTSGWSTGSHLHLEIHNNEGTINPIEVLPSLENQKTS